MSTIQEYIMRLWSVGVLVLAAAFTAGAFVSQSRDVTMRSVTLIDEGGAPRLVITADAAGAVFTLCDGAATETLRLQKSARGFAICTDDGWSLRLDREVERRDTWPTFSTGGKTFPWRVAFVDPQETLFAELTVDEARHTEVSRSREPYDPDHTAQFPSPTIWQPRNYSGGLPQFGGRQPFELSPESRRNSAPFMLIPNYDGPMPSSK